MTKIVWTCAKNDYDGKHRGIQLGVNILDTCGRDTYALNQSLEFIRASLNTFDVSQWGKKNQPGLFSQVWLNSAPCRYECSRGGTPHLKFNTSGPILGVIGGSYSSVSIQASDHYSAVQDMAAIDGMFDDAGCQLAAPVPDPPDLACLDSQGPQRQVEVRDVRQDGASGHFSSKASLALADFSTHSWGRSSCDILVMVKPFTYSFLLRER